MKVIKHASPDWREWLWLLYQWWLQLCINFLPSRLNLLRSSFNDCPLFSDSFNPNLASTLLRPPWNHPEQTQILWLASFIFLWDAPRALLHSLSCCSKLFYLLQIWSWWSLASEHSSECWRNLRKKPWFQFLPLGYLVLNRVSSSTILKQIFKKMTLFTVRNRRVQRRRRRYKPWPRKILLSGR